MLRFILRTQALLSSGYSLPVLRRDDGVAVGDDDQARSMYKVRAIRPSMAGLATYLPNLLTQPLGTSCTTATRKMANVKRLFLHVAKTATTVPGVLDAMPQRYRVEQVVIVSLAVVHGKALTDLGSSGVYLSAPSLHISKEAQRVTWQHESGLAMSKYSIVLLHSLVRRPPLTSSSLLVLFHAIQNSIQRLPY